MKINRFGPELVVTVHGDHLGDPDWWKDPSLNSISYTDLDSKYSWEATRISQAPSVREWYNPLTHTFQQRMINTWYIAGYTETGMWYSKTTEFPVNKHIYTDKEIEILARRAQRK